MVELAFEDHPLPMAVIDLDTLRYLAVNKATEQTSGFPRETMLNYTLWDNRAAADVVELRERWNRFPYHPVSYSAALRTASGVPYNAIALTVPVSFNGHRARLSIAVDRTALERADAARTERTKQMTLVAMAERARLAADLHDGPIQELSAAAFRLQTLAETNRSAAEALKLIMGSIAALRVTMDDLRPPETGEPKLHDALESIAQRVRAQDGFVLDVRCSHEFRLPEHVAASVYRVVLEAIANVRKHAGTRRLLCEVFAMNSDLVITLSDAGRGFDPASPQKGGRGLQMMRSRIEVLGGMFSLRSSPTGTIIEILLPHLAEVTPSVEP